MGEIIIIKNGEALVLINGRQRIKMIDSPSLLRASKVYMVNGHESTRNSNQPSIHVRNNTNKA